MEELLTPAKGHNKRVKTTPLLWSEHFPVRARTSHRLSWGRMNPIQGQRLVPWRPATRHPFLMLILFFCCGSSNFCVSIFPWLKKKDI